MAKLTDLFVKISADTKDFERSLKATERSLGQTSKSISAIGATMTAAFSLPLIGVAAVAFKAANAMDESFDTIRAATGATGGALRGLEGSFRNVFRQVPVGASAVATAIGDLSVKTGQTGKSLEGLAAQLLQLGRMQKAETGPLIAATTRAFGDWRISTDKQAASLDFLFKVSQSTGISVQKLTEMIVQSGAPLRAMGFSFEQAAALVGKFEKEGVITELVLRSLRTALTRMAKEGVTDAGEALKILVDRIRAAADPMQAITLAAETFGTKAAVDMSRAIIENRFSIDDLLKSLREGKETILGAAKDTESFAEKWTLLKNNVQLALEPLGKPMVTAMENILEKSKPLIKALQEMGEGFNSLKEPQQNFILGAAGLLVTIPLATLAIGKLIGVLQSILRPTMMAARWFVGPASLAASLVAVKVALLATAAAFTGWKLGEWLTRNIQLVARFGDALVTALRNIPGFDRISGFAAAERDLKGASEDLELTTSRLGLALMKKGIIVERGTMTDAEYSRALRAAAVASGLLAASSEESARILDSKVAPAAKKTKEEIAALTNAQREFDQWFRSSGQAVAGWWSEAGSALDDFLASIDVTATKVPRISGTLLDLELAAIGMNFQITEATNIFRNLPSAAEMASRGAREMGERMDKAGEAVKLLGEKAGRGTSEIAALNAAMRSVEAAVRDGMMTTEQATAAYEDYKAAIGKVISESGRVRRPLQEVSTILTNMGQQIGDLIVNWKSFGDTFIGIAKRIGSAIIADIIQNFILTEDRIKAITNALGAVLKQIPVIGGIFGGVAKAPSRTPLPGGAPIPGAGPPSAVRAAAGAGITGIVGAVAGVAGAVSSIIGNFQMAGMNKSLDLIEKATRYSEAYLLEILGTLQTNLPSVYAVNEILRQGTNALLGQINDALRIDLPSRINELRLAVAGGAGGLTINVSGNTFSGLPAPAAIDQFIEMIVARLRLHGVKP